MSRDRAKEPPVPSRVAEAAFVWSNRCDLCALPKRRLKPNAFGLPVRTSSGAMCRVTFTSYAKANAATTVQVMAMLDYPRQDYLAAARDAGYAEGDIHTYKEVKERADTLCTTPGTLPTGDGQMLATAGMTDLIVLPEVVVDTRDRKNFYGIILDAEWWDGRSEDVSTAFLKRLADIVHAKGVKLGMSNNPIIETGHVNGLGKNLNALNQSLDDIMVTISSHDPRRSFGEGVEASLDKFRGDKPVRYDRIILQFGLGVGQQASTLGQAEMAHQAIERHHLGGVMFAPLYFKATGLACDATGIKIQAVLGIPRSC